jgi:hypothetical protein
MGDVQPKLPSFWKFWEYGSTGKSSLMALWALVGAVFGIFLGIIGNMQIGVDLACGDTQRIRIWPLIGWAIGGALVGSLIAWTIVLLVCIYERFFSG